MADQPTAEKVAARLTDEQVDELVRLTNAIAGEDPYALDALVGTVESWIGAHYVKPPASFKALVSRVRSEADTSARPGQFDSLNAIADEMQAARKPQRARRMSDLTDFLLARIAEDEAAARTAPVDPLSVIGFDIRAHACEARDKGEAGAPPLLWASEHIAGLIHDLRPRTLHNPVRALAECEAKRRIVGGCAYATQEPFGEDYDLAPRYDLGDSVLRALASVYAAHPDYRQEWKP